MPRFSVIVPVHGQPELLSQCLRSIRASTFQDYELLVSDDGSPEPDRIQSAVSPYNVRLIRCHTRRGSAAARNRAALAACGDHLVFFDADVTVRPETLALLAQSFDRTPAPDAVIGSYDRTPSSPGRVSQFRNLLHAHAHQRSHGDATTFWAGCGAIRRERFLQLGGFRESFHRPSIEDVELGQRLHRAGGRILSAPEIEVTHHKAWTLYSMVRTDLIARAIPWAALIREHGLPRNLNFRISDRLGAAFTALAAVLAVIAVFHGPVYWGFFAFALIASGACQSSFLRFAASTKGPAFAIICFPLLLLYNLTCVAGLAAGIFYAECRRDRWFGPGLAACLCLILGLQIAGGAYRAEFDGIPDEAAQMVSGLMIYDYVTLWPHQNPLRWAERYYLHYPEIAIGRWPPGLHLMEAAWWLLFRPSRVSSMALNAVLLLAAAALFYRLLRSLAPGWVSLGAALLLILVPVVQSGAAESMAEVPCLLWTVLLTDAMVRMMRRPSLASASLVGVWLICAAFTKGTAACLAPAPVLALLMTGQGSILRNRWVLAGAAGVLSLVCIWYVIDATLLHQNLELVGGFTLGSLWPARLLPALAGYGFCLLALAGIWPAIIRRDLAAVASAAILISTLLVSCLVSAMREPRHFIIVAPAILLLSVEFLMWTAARARFAPVLVLPALALFPFHVLHQRPAGFVALLRQVRRPARMLVSSNSAGEGPWIAEVALAEKRPASVIARASKILAHSDWNGQGYILMTKTPEEIETRLDELRIETVILHSQPGRTGAPHHALLEQMLSGSESWRACGAAGTALSAYCRTRPPSVAPRPLRIDLTDKIGRFIEEP